MSELLCEVLLMVWLFARWGRWRMVVEQRALLQREGGGPESLLGGLLRVVPMTGEWVPRKEPFAYNIYCNKLDIVLFSLRFESRRKFLTLK